MGMKKSDKSVTLMDVAKRAGVGVGTASRVLNKDPPLPQDCSVRAGLGFL
mgnify:CR=1 FL=1